MGIRSFFGKPFARYIANQTKKWSSDPAGSQQKVFDNLIKKAASTKFGKDHNFGQIKSYDDFKANVPIRDYEQLKPYIEEMVAGKPDVLWPGKPIYLSKTSGTTSGVKYIPITKDSIPNHFVSARNAVLAYVAETGNADFLDGKLIFLSGSPELSKKNGIHVGRLSGIVNHHVPSYLRTNQMPSYETNCIDDWETKLKKIIDETLDKDM
ncbi:MAG: GH3 auxin-responsive promoter family protein, partial [Fulvivirga sp.]